MDKTDIRSACKDTDCSQCKSVNEPTCYNTEKRGKTPIYILRF